MDSSTKKYWALVKWVGGEYDKTYTVGIDTQHVKNFNYEEFTSEEEDPEKIYVVEWHDQPKEPPGGWLCYQARIIAVSTSRNILNKKLKALDGIESPKVQNTQETVPIKRKVSQAHCSRSVVDISTEENEGDEENPEDDTFVRQKIRLENDSSIDILGDDKEDENDENFTIKVGEKNGNSEIKKEIRKTGKETRKMTPVIQINEEVGHQYVTKDDLVKALRGMQQYQQPSTSQALQPRQKTKNSSSGGVKMLEIGDPGSNVFINEEQYSAAECVATPSAMTASLLLSVFGLDILSKSNYKGGAPKTTKDETKVQHNRLDFVKLNAIKQFVTKRFKNFKSSDFGRAVNNKCNKVRYELRQSKIHGKEKKKDDNSGSRDDR